MAFKKIIFIVRSIKKSDPAIEKFQGPSAKKGILKVVQRGDPLGQQGIESLKGGGGVVGGLRFS